MASRTAPDASVPAAAGTALGSPGSKLALGTAVLGPGLILQIYLQVDYLLVPYVCAGVRSAVWFHVLAAAALLAQAAVGLVAWRWWRRGGGERETGDGSVPAVTRFLGMLGVTLAAFFTLMTVAMWAGHLIMSSCQ